MPAIMPTVQYWIGDPSQYSKSRKKKKNEAWGLERKKINLTFLKLFLKKDFFKNLKDIYKRFLKESPYKIY